MLDPVTHTALRREEIQRRKALVLNAQEMGGLQEFSKKARLDFEWLRQSVETYKSEGEESLVPPDWADGLDDRLLQKANEIRKQIMPEAEKLELTREDINRVASRIDRSARTAERRLFEFRRNGLVGLILPPSANMSQPNPETLSKRRVFSNEEIDEISSWREDLQPYIRQPLSEEEAENIGSKHGCKARNVRNKLDALRKKKYDRIVRKERSDAGTHRGVSERMVRVIQGIREENPYMTIEDIHEEAQKIALALGERIPSPYQVRQICAEIPPVDRDRTSGRENDFRGRTRFTGHMHHSAGVEFQMDIKRSNNFVEDERKSKNNKKNSKKHLVRTYRITILEVRSRRILTTRPVYGRPDQEEVAATIRNAIIEGGRPNVIRVDNGWELIAQRVWQFCYDLDIG